MIKIIKQEIKINYELIKNVEWSRKLNNSMPVNLNVAYAEYLHQ